MTTKDLVLQKLQELKNAGYVQVSASELAHTLDLPARAIVASIRHTGISNFKRGDETFVRLTAMHLAVSLREFGLKSPIVREVE